MRTTLKRGIGRGAAVTGNGRPVLPPGALSPITIYRQPEPPPRSGWATLRTIVAWVLVALLVVVGSIAGGAYLWFHESVAAVVATTPDVKIAAKRLDVALPGQPATALVVGYDQRAGEGAGTKSRSDTVMLVRADPETEVGLDALVPARPLRRDPLPGRATFSARINGAYSECGTKGTLETVRKLTGLPINYLITVNFRGFRQLVDAVGGVWIDVDRRYFNDRGGDFGYATINLFPGYQKLGGYQALDFVRYRHTDSDLYRVARQQLFVRAFKDQIKSSTGAARPAQGRQDDHRRTSRSAQGGNKELDLKTVLRYALFAYALPPGHFFQAEARGPRGDRAASTCSCPRRTSRRRCRSSPTPTSSRREKATRRRAEREAEAVRRQGAAAARDDRQRAERERRARARPAPRAICSPSAATRWSTRPTARTGTRRTGSTSRPGSTTTRRSPARRRRPRRSRSLFGTDDVVPLDAGDRGALERRAPDRDRRPDLPRDARRGAGRQDADSASRRTSLPGADASLALLRERATEDALRADGADGARAELLDRPRAAGARCTGSTRTGSTRRSGSPTAPARSEYWGVQMTDWEDAPVLSERNVIRTIEGRRYELHYTGAEAAHGRAAAGRRELLGREHAARLALERDDARDREGSQTAS